MSGVFLFALLLAQQPDTDTDAPPPPDAPEETAQPAPAEDPGEPETPAVTAQDAPQPPPDTPAAETPPPPAKEPPPAAAAPAAPPPVLTTTPRWVGTTLTAGSMAAGVPLAFLCGLAAAIPVALVCTSSWLWWSTSGGPRVSLRWYDALQLAALFSPVLLLAGCLAAPLGIPLALVSSTLGVVVPRKPSLDRLRAAAAAATPGVALAAVPAAVMAGGLVSCAVLLTSLVTFWLTYSPSLGPEFPMAPRFWHQVNNVACCCLGLSLVTTPALALAWPAAVGGACTGFGWTSWRAGKARAQLDCPPDAPCAQGGDA